MKLGLVTPHYPPDLSGASEFVAHAEACELTKRGHGVRVATGCTWEHSGRDVLRGRIDDSDVAYLPLLEGEHERDQRERWVRLVLEELRGVDACWVHYSASLASGLIQPLARRMPVIVCIDEADDLERIADELVHADRILVATHEIADLLVEAQSALAGRLEVCSFGLCRSISPLRASQRRAAWDGSRPMSLFHFGRRSESSGLPALLDGLRELPTGRFELVLAGGEAEPGFDSSLERRAGETPVHFFGPYQTDQLAALGSACDLAVFPGSIARGQGPVVDEALALGLPVWCCEAADPLGRIREPEGTPFALGQARLQRVQSRPGRILPANSPDAWTSAFEQLLEDPEQHHAERHAIPQSFETTSERVARLENLFGDLLSHAFRKAS